MLLAVELFDELVYGAREAAWPLIRADLGLSYAQVGVLLSVPGLLAALIEPALGVLADGRRRRALVLGGGAAFVAALLLAAAAGGFAPLLAAFVLMGPASGAFVSLSQATLTDLDPARRERSMARWVVAGSVGAVAGPLVLAAVVALGGGWRGSMWGFAALGLLLALLARGVPFRPAAGHEDDGLRAGLGRALAALRDREVLRWLLLLELTDLAGDVLLGFLALYVTDVAGGSAVQAGLAVTVWTGAGLAGDAALLVVLRRVPGLRYLRAGALAVLLLLPAFLLAPGLPAKLGVLALLGALNAGWYAIPQARLYEALPGRSGAAVALSSLAGLVGELLPLGMGLLAAAAGLGTALWVTLLAPLSVLALVPRERGPGPPVR
ncbi:MAG TPA: MFS transporter [Actinomycetes bacterium]|nr:MFS transporter [Actinomycetes bacterium]